MPPYKAVKTYEKKDRSVLHSSKDAVNALFVQNITKRLLGRKRKQKIKLKELPPRTEPYLTDDSLKVNTEDTFDRLAKGKDYNKVKIRSNPKINVTTSESEPEPSKNKLAQITVSFHSPIMTRRRRRQPPAIDVTVPSQSSSSSQTKSLAAVKRDQHSYLNKSINSSISIEKDNKKAMPFTFSSLSYIRAILPAKDGIKATAKTPAESVSQDSKQIPSVSTMDTSYRPIFSQTFREKQMVHSSTPCVNTEKKKIVIDPISPIFSKSSSSSGSLNIIEKSYDEIKKWETSFPLLEENAEPATSTSKFNNTSWGKNPKKTKRRKLSSVIEPIEIDSSADWKLKCSPKVHLHASDILTDDTEENFKGFGNEEVAVVSYRSDSFKKSCRSYCLGFKKLVKTTDSKSGKKTNNPLQPKPVRKSRRTRSCRVRGNESETDSISLSSSYSRTEIYTRTRNRMKNHTDSSSDSKIQKERDRSTNNPKSGKENFIQTRRMAQIKSPVVYLNKITTRSSPIKSKSPVKGMKQLMVNLNRLRTKIGTSFKSSNGLTKASNSSKSDESTSSTKSPTVRTRCRKTLDTPEHESIEKSKHGIKRRASKKSQISIRRKTRSQTRKVTLKGRKFRDEENFVTYRDRKGSIKSGGANKSASAEKSGKNNSIKTKSKPKPKPKPIKQSSKADSSPEKSTKSRKSSLNKEKSLVQALTVNMNDFNSFIEDYYGHSKREQTNNSSVEQSFESKCKSLSECIFEEHNYSGSRSCPQNSTSNPIVISSSLDIIKTPESPRNRRKQALVARDEKTMKLPAVSKPNIVILRNISVTSPLVRELSKNIEHDHSYTLSNNSRSMRLLKSLKICSPSGKMAVVKSPSFIYSLGSPRRVYRSTATPPLWRSPVSKKITFDESDSSAKTGDAASPSVCVIDSSDDENNIKDANNSSRCLSDVVEASEEDSVESLRLTKRQRNSICDEKKEVFKKPVKKTSNVLKPGKLYRRSLALLRKSFVVGNNSTTTCPKDCTCITPSLDLVATRCSQIVPISHDISCNGSILEIYAKRKSSYATADAQQILLHDILDDSLKNLSLSPRRSLLIEEDQQDTNCNELPVVTAKDVVLRKCGQTEPLPFEDLYPTSLLQNCHKIGEGVYGEVFLYRNPNGGTSVMKIIPIEGDLSINGERQKRYDEILSEIVIAMELSNLRNNSKTNYTTTFSEVQKVKCVQGRYPDRLIDLWNLFEETQGTENDSPAIFPDQQLYVVLEFDNGGKSLESFVFNNAQQVFSVFRQVACALAVAESQLKFEHRDLHWGNVLVRNVDKNTTIRYCLNGQDIQIASCGVEVCIIDFTLSRVEFDGVVIYNDLSLDKELFTGQGDYQFDIYRLMQQSNENIWQHFEPYTNILWLGYLLEKAPVLHYVKPKSKLNIEFMSKLNHFKEEILSFNSAVEFVTGNFI